MTFHNDLKDKKIIKPIFGEVLVHKSSPKTGQKIIHQDNKESPKKDLLETLYENPSTVQKDRKAVFGKLSGNIHTLNTNSK